MKMKTTALLAGLAVIAAVAIPAIAADTAPPFGPGYGWHRGQMAQVLNDTDGSFVPPMMMNRRGVTRDEFKRLVDEGKIGPEACPMWQAAQTDKTTTDKPAQ